MQQRFQDSTKVEQQDEVVHFQQVLKDLELKTNPNNIEDTRQLQLILTKYLFYPSDQMAQVHEESYRLGDKDVGSIRQQLKDEFIHHGMKQEVCPCCCCLRQEDLSFATRLDDLETVGESTILYFLDMRYTASVMLMSFLTYGLFALITNIYAQESCLNTLSCIINKMSIGAKLLNPTPTNTRNYIIQVWLGVIMVVFWNVLSVFKKITERQIENQQDIKNTTASDFSVMIENLPKHYTKETLQRDFNKYRERVKDKIQYPDPTLYPDDNYDGMFTISNFNTARAYYQVLEAIEKEQKQQPIQKQLNDDMNELRDWIKYRQTHYEFPVDKQCRQQLYKEIDRLKKQTNTRRNMLMNVIEEDFQILNETKSTKLAFVTFNHSYARINFCALNKPGILARLHDMTEFNEYRMKIDGMKVSRAPEPEDINWQNIGLPIMDRTLRKTFTFSATVVILCISFFIIYKLTTFQVRKQQQRHTFVPILISLVIVGFNSFLSYIIKLLTQYEKDYRATFYQVSLSVKIVIAQLVNSVLISFIAAYFIKKNIYRRDGLADDVFWFGISNAFVSPFIRLIDFYYQIVKLIRKNKSKPLNKLQFETQLDYNMLWQGLEFQIGAEYVYLLKTSIYTCFYISLQPIIALLSAIGIAIAYFVHRYIIYYRSCKPRLGSNIINKQLDNILRMSLISYAIGSIIWTQIITIGGHNQTILPNMIALGLGILVFAYPRIFKAFKLENDVPLVYQNERMFLFSEYDRLNPCTRQEGLKDYRKFFEKKRQEYEKISKSSRQNSMTHMMNQMINKSSNPLDLMINVAPGYDKNYYKESQQIKPSNPITQNPSTPVTGSPFSPFIGNLFDPSRANWNPIHFGLSTIVNNFDKLNSLAQDHNKLVNVRHQKTFRPTQYLNTTQH